MPSAVFIMLDGVRPDALTVADCPNLNALRERSASTMQARTVIPSITLPCHTSIFHNVPPSRHGITSNTFAPMARPLPGLAEVARAADKRVAFFYNWEPLRDLSRPGSVHYSYFRDSALQADGDDKIVDEAARYIPQERPDLAFIYFGTVDTAGHQYGWMTHEYLRQLEHIDSLLGRFFDSLPDEYTTIIHSDHGGHERNHGTDCEEDMTVPWMAVGPNIKQGYTIQKQVSLLDTAPTLTIILGIKPHHEWEGRVVQEIFIS